MQHGNYYEDLEYISPEYDEECINFFVNYLRMEEPDRWDHIANMSIQNDDIEALNKEFELLYNTVCEIRKKMIKYNTNKVRFTILTKVIGGKIWIF